MEGLGQTQTLKRWKPPVVQGVNRVEAEIRAKKGKEKHQKMLDVWNVSIPSASTPGGAIRNVRAYYDSITAKKIFFMNPPTAKADGYLKKYFPNLESFNPFYHLAWDLIMPQQAGVGLHPLLVGISPPPLPDKRFGYERWMEIYGTTIPLPSRMNADNVAARLKVLGALSNKFTAFTLQTWGSYSSAIMGWARDPSVGDATLRVRSNNLGCMMEAWKAVPWPMEFFSSFLPNPIVSVPIFGGGVLFNDPAIATSSYFPTTLKNVKSDIALYLYNNEVAFSEHFRISAERWLEEKEKEIKNRQKKAEQLGMFLDVVSGLLSLLPGAILFTTFLLDLPKLAFDMYHLKKIGKMNLKYQKAALKIWGFDEHDMKELGLWIEANAILPPAVPPAPGGEGRYALWINENFVGKSDDNAELISYANATTKIGDRVDIVDEQEDATIGVFLKRKGKLELMPELLAAKVQSLDHDQTTKIANELDGTTDIPVWLVAVPIIGIIVATSG